MHDDEPLDRDREEAQQRRDRAAGLVHVRRGHGDDGRRAGDAAGTGTEPHLRGVGAGLVRAQLRAVRGGRARRPPWRRRCAGCRRRPGRGCPARRRARVRSRSPDQYAVAPGTRQGPVRVDRALPWWCRWAERPGWLRPRRRPSSPSVAAASPAGASPASSSDSSRSMPASASASASSASRASSETCAVTLTTSASASVTRVAPSGSSTWPARIWVPAARPSTETVMLSGMSVARTSSCRLVWSVVTTVSGRGLALEVHVDVDDDLLALVHDDQVDVLDDRLDRVALDVLGERELLLAVDDDGEQGVALLQREHRLRGPGG